jgi:hypothetical protein
MRIATIMVPSRGMTLRLFSRISLTRGPCRGPSVGGRPPRCREGGRASGRKGPSGAFREGIRRTWGPSDDVGGAAPTRPIASNLIGGWADDVIA